MANKKGTPQYEEWLRQYREKRKAKDSQLNLFPEETAKIKEVLSSKKKKEEVKPEQKQQILQDQTFQVYSKSQGKFLQARVVRYNDKAGKFLVLREDGKYLYYDSSSLRSIKDVKDKTFKREKKESISVVPEGTKSERIEKAVEPVAFQISMNGLYLNREKLKEFSSALQEKISQKEQELFDLAGHKFNYNSVNETRAVLFEELGYVAESASTAQEALAKLADGDENSVPARISEIRSLRKLNSSYFAKLDRIAAQSEDGRIRNLYTPHTVSGRYATEFNPKLVSVEVPEGKELEDKVYFAEDLEELGLQHVCSI